MHGNRRGDGRGRSGRSRVKGGYCRTDEGRWKSVRASGGWKENGPD